MNKLKNKLVKARLGVAFVFAGLLMLKTVSEAHGLPIVADHFTRTGRAEALTAPLAVFGGVTTSQQWSGNIELIVSNVGHNFPAIGGFTDAFYYYIPGNPDLPIFERDNQNWALRMSFLGCAAGLECGAPSVLDFTIFTEGVGFVTPLVNHLPGAPGLHEVMPFRADHNYHFVIDVGNEPRFLTLGYGDGGVFDNGGRFDILLVAVVPNVVPEPISFALVIIGLAGLGFSRWRKK